MAQTPDSEASYEVLCPHCEKTFEAPLLSGAADRYQGFKCPHCRLFVAYERADEQDRVEQQDGAPPDRA